ncbi:MAG: Ig-like domain-containing protein [Bacteroidota bacterium]|nr:Ig-like domain-containing protein [Bacteroidota bacterium]
MRFLKIVFVLSLLFFLGCAKRGRVSGGAKDITPPVVVNTAPHHHSVNFSGNQIEITFDEFVKLKNANKNVSVSPPLEKRLQITPTAVTKKIKLTFQEELKPNTTYTINFGESIQDNNEGNILRDYSYVFSTGSYLDSLRISGSITDAFQKEIGEETKILLYEFNEQYTDSVPYLQLPTYISYLSKDATTFQMNNLKEGKYRLLAITDKNGNRKYDPKQDKIGFVEEIINLPTYGDFQLRLFKEQLNFKPIRAFQENKNKIILAYEGVINDVDVQLLANGSVIPTKQTKIKNKDSLAIWFNPILTDSLVLQVKGGTVEKSFTLKSKDFKNDTLQLKFESKNTIGFSENLKVLINTPIEQINQTKINIFDKDSLKVAFTIENKQEHEFELAFEKQEKHKYTIEVLPGAVVDYFGKTNDTVVMNTTTRNFSDYGNLKIILENIEQYPIIVELLDQKNNVYRQQYHTEHQTELDFVYINPGIYSLRIIYDVNGNKQWDTGNFMLKQQPEKLLYYPKNIDVRANWDVNERFRIVTDKN